MPCVPAVEAPPQSGIATHYLRYLGANLLVMAAGFVSFPVMTRLLDNHQFGILGYYEAWLLVGAGVLKLGSQHAILRFYPHGGDRAALRQFRSDLVLMPFLLSLFLWACCVLAVASLVERLPSAEQPVIWILMLTAPLIIWCSFIEALMYALERSDITLWLKSAWRWSELALVLTTIWLIERSAFGVLTAKFAVVAVVAVWLGFWFRRWFSGRFVLPSRPTLAAGLAFGVPMMFNELNSLLFAFGDRILLRLLSGSLSEVGIYTIGYGLALSLTAVLGATLAQAFTPRAVRLYESAGPAAVVALKRDMLDVWLLAVATATALLLCVGQDLLVALAGPAKAASGPVFVVIAITMVWYSLFDIAQYGLLLQRRALRFLLVSLAATLLNLGLNLPLIPAYGVMGAVAATVIGYAFLAALQYAQCPRELRHLPAFWRLAAAVLFPLAMYELLSLVDYFGATTAWTRLAVGTLLIGACALALAACDRPLRAGVRRMLGNGAAPAAS
jgi:O-antigen/teichoic acid export membrane protein